MSNEPNVETGTISHRGLKIRVNILQTRKIFGRTDVQIEPVEGHGKIWTRRNSVKSVNPTVETKKKGK